MLGAIIGDTVGSAYEFQNTKDYNFTLFLGNSAYTDDSVMTMAVANWLLKDKKHSYQELEDIMIMFAEKYPCPMGGYGGGFYTWLFESEGLYNFDDRYGSAPYKSKTGRHPYGSWGNGSAMRVSAVGWFFDTLEETERVAAISSAITHNHPEGIKGAQTTAAAIWMARNGKDKEEIRDYIEKTYGYDLHKTYAYWHPIYHWESSCQGTVPQAIIAFLDSTDFEDAIRHMTISQGQLLVRLVDRELGKTAYAVVKDYKSTAAAGFWQGVAKLFGQDLKNRYDPEGADKQTERLVELWEKGEFDLFYYSIFFEWPKKTEIPSEYQ